MARPRTRSACESKLEIRDVTWTLLEHERLFLIGPRRHGKTAILHAACLVARRADAVVISLDAESYAGLDELVRALVAQAARLLKSDVERTGEKILAFFSKLRPVITYNPADGEWSATIASDEPREYLPLFIEALHGVARLARQADKPVAVVEAILGRAEDVPYNVQALSSVAWDLLRDRAAAVLTPSVVQQALDLLVSRDSPFYVTLWNSLTDVQKRLLRAVIREHGVELASNAAVKSHGLAVSTVSKTLRLLEERQLLRSEERERHVRWRFEDPFFAAWIAR